MVWGKNYCGLGEELLWFEGRTIVVWGKRRSRKRASIKRGRALFFRGKILERLKKDLRLEVTPTWGSKPALRNRQIFGRVVCCFFRKRKNHPKKTKRTRNPTRSFFVQPGARQREKNGVSFGRIFPLRTVPLKNQKPRKALLKRKRRNTFT